ncbi:MAG TPA: PPOX class F420-dependent oxidoreductase, partial [Ktedonosporobacter sp.]|nr:PPOX class F420-dependent oxidoreductase [Ktedonosporobacter sp.]
MSKVLSDQARAFLQERRFAVLATINRDGSPQLSAMWYQLLDDGTIMMNTKVGRLKERNLRRDPRVSVCWEDGGYLTITGKAVLIDDPELGQQNIHRLAVRYNGEEAARKQVEDQFSKEERVTIHIKPDNIIEAM